MKNKSEHIEAVDYVNPNIGGMAHLLIPTLPLVHLPNSMMRLSRQPQGYQQEVISYFPISIVSHRVGTVGRLMVTSGDLNTQPNSWPSAYDHDFEEAKIISNRGYLCASSCILTNGKCLDTKRVVIQHTFLSG